MLSTLARFPRTLGAPLRSALATSTFVGFVAVGCSVSEGQGAIEGTINVADCWSGRFAFTPDFFAGVPYRRSLEIRIQEGGDYSSFSDGFDINVRDIDAILGDPAQEKPSRLGQPIEVKLSSEVTPPGVPITPVPDASMVDIALYLQRTCKTQNVALYAGTVALNDDGSCGETNANAPVCPVATPGTGKPPPSTAVSTITFQHLFNGIPEEPDAAKRLTEASFDLYFADPREVCPGGLGPAPRCRGHIKGSFRFLFERGRPAQRFP